MLKDADDLNLGLATLVAPLSIPLLGLFIILVFTEEPIGGLNGLVLIWATAVSYLGCLLFGIPIVHILNRWNRLTVSALCVSGFFSGMVVTFLFAFLLGATVGLFGVEQVKLGGVIFFGLAGAVVGTVFGLIARVRLY